MRITIDPLFWQVARWLLAAVFAAALWHKLRQPREFVRVIRDYRLLPGRLAPPAAASSMALEGLVMVGLASGLFMRPVAMLAIALLGIYFSAIGANLLRGRVDIDCGCMGPAAGTQSVRRLSGWLLFRNAILIGIAGLLLAPVSGRDLLWLDLATVVPGVLVASLLYFTADQLMANRPILESMLR